MALVREGLLCGCLLFSFVGQAAVGHIYDIRPYGDDSITTGPMSSVADPKRSGDVVRFAVRLACTSEHSGDANYKWRLSYIGMGSPEVAQETNPLQMGIIVSGELRLATLVSVVPSASGNDYTDLIFEYVVRPGDFALPVVLALADGSPASSGVTSDLSYYISPLSQMDWAIVNNNGDRANFWFGNWGWIKPAGAGYSVNDYDLRAAGFYVKAVDFDDSWESQDCWRSVHEGSTATAGAQPMLCLDAPATNSTTLHIWSDDSSAVVMQGDGAYDVVMKLNASGTSLATNRVLDITIRPGQTAIPFDIRGVAADKTANLILSSTTNFSYNWAGMRIEDYVSVPVKCSERLPATVTATTDGDLEIVNVGSDYATPVGTMTVRASTGYGSSMTVTVTPRLRDGSSDWADYIHLATQNGIGSWASASPCTLAFTAAELANEATAQKTIYIYAMGADAHTASVSAGIVFDVTIDDASGQYYETVTCDSLLWLKPTAPTVTSPAEGDVFKARGNVKKSFGVALSDSYKNLCDTNVGYEIWYKRKATDVSYEKMTPQSGVWAVDENGILRDQNGMGDLPSILYSTAGLFESSFYVVAPDGTTKSAVRSVMVDVSEPPSVSVSTSLVGEVATEGTNVNVTVHLSEAVENDGQPVYAFLVPKDEASSNLVACGFLAKEGAKGVKILAGKTNSTTTAMIRFLDGTAEGLELHYNIVLCRSQVWDGGNLVTEFNCVPYEPIAYNVMSHVHQVKVRDAVLKGAYWCTVDEPGETVCTTYRGVEKEFQCSVWEPGQIDLSTTNVGQRFELRYTIQEANGAGCSQTLYGNPALTNFTHTFSAIGTATIRVQVRDKDMMDADEWSDEFICYVEVRDNPHVSIESESGSFLFSEDNVGARNAAFTVRLSENWSTIPLEVEISVKSAATGMDNPGTLRLGGCTPTSNGFYLVTFDKAVTAKKIYIDEADGTRASATKGFVVTARVVTHETNVFGFYWDEFYSYESKTVFVDNTPPSVTTSLGAENDAESAFLVALGDGDVILWSVDDIECDLGQVGSSTNITIQWTSPGLCVMTNVCDSTNAYYFTPKFVLPGLQTVTVTLTDKDKDSGYGTLIKTWYFDVRDLLPQMEDPTPEEISSALQGAVDATLAAKITDATAYSDFRNWAKKVQPHGGGEPVGTSGVMAAPNAWVAYALGSETLLEAAPTDEDLTVEAFEPKSGEDGKFDFTVSVKDVEVGAAATTEAQKEAVKENLKQVFGLEGGTTLEEGGMSSANVEIEFGAPQDGKVKFTAGPKDADAKTFFMKVKVK